MQACLHAPSPCPSQWRSRLGCVQASGLCHQERGDLVRNTQVEKLKLRLMQQARPVLFLWIRHNFSVQGFIFL